MMALNGKWMIVAALLGSGSTPLFAQTASTIEEMARTPVITVRISESLRTLPDQASLTLSTESKAPAAAAALAGNKAKMARLIASVHSAGIGDKDIQTESINISPDYRYDQVNGRGQQRMVGYNASSSVQIKTRRLDRLSTLLDSLAAAGVDRIYGPRFTIADPAPLRREARKRALGRGAAEATEYARMAGFGRVELLSLEEGISSSTSDYIIVSGRSPDGVPPPPPPPAPMAPERDGGSIQPGQIETGVALTLRYRMER